jgi:hypothetical protein
LRDALLEVKPLVEDALSTVALLEQRRSLTDREQRQASALRRFQTTIAEACGDDRTIALCSDIGPLLLLSLGGGVSEIPKPTALCLRGA